jgi:hypothetical protein
LTLMPKENKIDLIIVVNGQPVTVEANIHEPLQTAVRQALNDSGNSGQPIDNWELRDGSGQVLDLSRKIVDFHFQAGTRLFLNLKAGVGG